MRDILTAGLAELGLAAPPEALERLERYAALLLEKNQVMNLTAITEPEAVARLHFLDSAAVLAYGRADEEQWHAVPYGRADEGGGRQWRPVPHDRAEGETIGPYGGGAQADGAVGASGARYRTTEPKARPVGASGARYRTTEPTGETIGPYAKDAGPGNGDGTRQADGDGARAGGSWLAGRAVLDVGTGAGFPGMVLKILEPSIRLTLLDSLGKRLDWLGEVCKALSLDVRLVHARAEEQGLLPGWRDSFDVVTSRAVAALPALTELCLPFVRPGGQFIAMKSVDDGELAAGQRAVGRLGGKVDRVADYPVPGAGVVHRLIIVDKTAPTPKGYPRRWGQIKKAPL